MGNLLSDDVVLDARNDDITFDPPWGKVKAGVRLRPPGYIQKEDKRWAVYEFGTPEMYSPWKQALMSQVGKPYDSEGIWQFVVGLFRGVHYDHNYHTLDPSQSRAWFCDALGIFGASYGCGFLKLDPDYRPYNQTPGAALNLFIGAGARCVASGH